MVLGSKKGFMYTFIVILLIAVLFSIYASEKTKFIGNNKEVVVSRVMAMNDFLDDFDRDLDRAVFIATFRTFLALENHIVEQGSYLPNLESMFTEIIYNGTINGTSQSIMENASLEEYLNRVNQNANRRNMQTELSVSSINFTQETPWIVKVVITLEVNLTDASNSARWDFIQDYDTFVPIDNLFDPLYSVGTLGRLKNPISQFNTTDFVDNVTKDSSNLQLFQNQSYYKSSDKAPSFIMRFSGNFSDNPNGIESFVDLDLLQSQDIDIDTELSVVDYLYFGNTTTNLNCEIDTMPDWFKIDDAHINDYEINQLNYTSC